MPKRPTSFGGSGRVNSPDAVKDAPTSSGRVNPPDAVKDAPTSSGRVNSPEAVKDRHEIRSSAAGAHSETGREGQQEEVLRAELAAFAKGTFEAVIKRAVQLIAELHSCGWLYKAAEWALTGAKWIQFATGRRKLDLEVPLDLGSNVELDVTAHIGRYSSAEPVVTACFAPSGGSEPGVLVIDGCQISPGDIVDDSIHKYERIPDYAWKHSSEGKHSQLVDNNRVTLIPLGLSPLTAVMSEPRKRVAVLMHLAKSELLPKLAQQRRWKEFRTADEEYIIYYDQEAKESVWLIFTDSASEAIKKHMIFDAKGTVKPRLCIIQPGQVGKDMSGDSQQDGEFEPAKMNLDERSKKAGSFKGPEPFARPPRRPGETRPTDPPPRVQSNDGFPFPLA
jgi:hypothetical protein